jgi:hypothetical protein
MLKTVGTPGKCYRRGDVVKLPEAEAYRWVRSGLAKLSADLPAEERDFNERFQIGTAQPCIYLPFTGEFGHLIMHRVRWVHFHPATHKVVCCREGEQVLFPSAQEFITDWIDPVPDRRKAGTMRAPLDFPDITARFPDHTAVHTWLTHDQEFHHFINIDEPIRLEPIRRGLKADVVLGIRQRDFCPQKNWPRRYWQRLADAITAAGFTVAVAGRRPHTHDLDGITHHAGDYPDTDAAIELIQGCRLFIGTDTGVAHLASLVGCPMLLFREEARQYRNYIPRMIRTNHPHPVTMLEHVWDRPEEIIKHAVAALHTA